MHQHSRLTLSLIILLLVVLIPVAALNFSGFLKSFLAAESVLTGRIIQEDLYYCGPYSQFRPSNAVASSILGGSFSAASAIDGNTNTRWVGNNTKPYPKWIYFDLGEKKCVNGIDVYLAAIDVPITMNVETSDDNLTWVPATSGWQVTQGGFYQTQLFAEKRARFIRLYQTAGPSTYGALAEFRASIAPLVFNASGIANKCEDSDGGKNYSKKGIVNVFNQSGVSQAYEDGCFSVRDLYEYFCNGSEVALETVNCEGICSEGICAPLRQNNANTENAAAQPEQEEDSDFGEEIKESPELKCGNYELSTPKAALANSQFHNFKASNAIDGNPETHWFGDPAKKYPKWIVLDLGRQKCVNGMEIEMFIWDVPITFDIQTSLDNRQWSAVQENVVITDGGTRVKKDFTETQARFVRLYQKEGRRPYGTLSEIQISTAPYGKEAERAIQLKTENVVGSSTPDKFYDIKGRYAFIEIDGKPVEEYF